MKVYILDANIRWVITVADYYIKLLIFGNPLFQKYFDTIDN